MTSSQPIETGSDSGNAGGLTFGLLGPLEIRRDGEPVALTGSPKAHRLLAVLLVRAPKAVPVTTLDEHVWGRAAEPSLRQKYIGQARRDLGPGRSCLRLTEIGYALRVDPDTIDINPFADAVDRGLAAARRGDRAAADDLRAALRLWRGEPLAGLGRDGWAAGERRKWARKRLAAAIVLHRLELLDGATDELADATAHLLADNPDDEDAVENHMLTLYARGAGSRALAVHDDLVRRRRRHPPLADLRSRIRSGRLDIRDWLARRMPAATPAAPQQLPAPTAAFAGRDAEIDRLDRLADGLDPDGPSRTIAVDGPPGVGKTVLAIHWAHRVAHRYPDGVLFLNLRGFDPGGDPVGRDEALKYLLTSLGDRGATARTNAEGLLGRYRTATAGRRLLLVLDNAASADQVVPLVPPGPGSLVLTTSRRRLPELGALAAGRFVPIARPAEEAAADLLRSHLTDARGDGEPEAVAEIVRLCGRLPLALAIVGARASARPDQPLRAILEQLRAGLGGTAGFRAVAGWSYERLPVVDRLTFRVLGLHPGPELDVTAVASLAATTPVAAARAVRQLSAVRLVEQPAPTRFALHDLVREYAAGLAADEHPEPRGVVARRMLDFYLHSADRCATALREHRQPVHLDPPAAGVGPVDVTGAEEAIHWFTTEHTVLIRLIRCASGLGHPAYAWKLLSCMVDYLDREGHWADWRDAAVIAAEAAEKAGDLPGVARSRRSAGRAHARFRAYAEAETELRAALGIYARLDDADGQMRLRHDLRDLYVRQRRHEEALAEVREAHRLALLTGDEREQASALDGSAWTLAQLGRFEDAAGTARRAIRLHHGFGYRHGEAAARDTLGLALHHLGRCAEAVVCFTASRELRRAVGDRIAEAEVLDHLGDCRAGIGNETAARTAWHAALDILAELRHPYAEVVRGKLDGE